jgi:hypothetical protein
LPVEQVTKTNIFVGLNSSKTSQLTVYSNFVSNNSNSNAMVIPVPFPSTVKFHDVSSIKNFFKSVDQSFYRLGANDFYSTNTTRGEKTKTALDVFSIGSYQVSLAHNLTDISRLNKDLFILSPGLAKTLEEHYSNSVWGFIVFVLARDKKDYNPFAFSHSLYNNKIYIPTRHYHDSLKTNSVGYMDRIGGIDTRSNPYEDQFNSMPMFNSRSVDENDSMADDWSHNIYLFNCGNSGSKSQLLQSMLNPEYKYACDRKLYWNRKLINFDLEACDGFEKYNIEGNHPNLDIMIPVC